MHLANAENGPTDSGRDRPEIEESRFCVPELMEFEASLEARLGGEQISRLTGIVSVATRDVRFRTFSGPSGPRLGRSQRS